MNVRRLFTSEKGKTLSYCGLYQKLAVGTKMQCRQHACCTNTSTSTITNTSSITSTNNKSDNIINKRSKSQHKLSSNTIRSTN